MNNDMIIKVCGMRDAENIRQVAALGIDWMGFIFFPKSPRYVSQLSSNAGIIPDYSSLIGKTDNDVSASKVKRVGVFVDDMPQNIVTRVYNYKLDIVQLHGSENTVMNTRTMKVMSITSSSTQRHSLKVAAGRSSTGQCSMLTMVRRRSCLAVASDPTTPSASVSSAIHNA